MVDLKKLAELKSQLIWCEVFIGGSIVLMIAVYLVAVAEWKVFPQGLLLFPAVSFIVGFGKLCKAAMANEVELEEYFGRPVSSVLITLSRTATGFFMAIGVLMVGGILWVLAFIQDAELYPMSFQSLEAAGYSCSRMLGCVSPAGVLAFILMVGSLFGLHSFVIKLPMRYKILPEDVRATD